MKIDFPLPVPPATKICGDFAGSYLIPKPKFIIWVGLRSRPFVDLITSLSGLTVRK